MFERGGLRAIAFPVDHGHVTNAYGYRIEYMDRSVVISGDTRLSNSPPPPLQTSCCIRLGCQNPETAALRHCVRLRLPRTPAVRSRCCDPSWPLCTTTLMTSDSRRPSEASTTGHSLLVRIERSLRSPLKSGGAGDSECLRWCRSQKKIRLKSDDVCSCETSSGM